MSNFWKNGWCRESFSTSLRIILIKMDNPESNHDLSRQTLARDSITLATILSESEAKPYACGRTAKNINLAALSNILPFEKKYVSILDIYAKGRRSGEPDMEPAEFRDDLIGFIDNLERRHCLLPSDNTQYAVMIENRQTPTRLHPTYEEALEEVRRLYKYNRVPMSKRAYILEVVAEIQMEVKEHIKNLKE